MATAKDCHALTTYFVKCWEKRYGRKPSINRYKARYGFEAILDDMGSAAAKELVDFYFTTPGQDSHNLEWFFWNYNKLVDSRSESQKDAEHIAKLRAESKKRAEEWKKSGKQGITDA